MGKLEIYYLGLVEGRKRGFFAFFLKSVLLLASFLFSFIVRVRYFLYKIGLFKRFSAKAFVISVGNIAVGGAGKTSFSLYLAKQLEKSGLACVLGGYCSKAEKSRKPVYIPADKKISARDVGDEACLFREVVPKVPLFVGEKWRACKLADTMGAKCIIVDDAMQHFAVRRDIDIVVLDAKKPFGYSLPRELFRERPSALARADLIVLHHADRVADPKAVCRTIRWYSRAPIIMTGYQTVGFRDSKGNPVVVEQSPPVGVFCGIGQPESFFRQIEDEHLLVKDALCFPDHTVDPKVVVRFAEVCASLGAKMLITTQKDIVRFDKVPKTCIPIVWLEVELFFLEGKELLDRKIKEWARY